MRIEHRRMNKKKQINKIMKVNNVVQRVVYDIIRWNVHNGIQGRSKLWTSKVKKMSNKIQTKFQKNVKTPDSFRIIRTKPRAQAKLKAKAIERKASIE